MVAYISIVLSFREGVHEVLNMLAGLKTQQLFRFTFKIVCLHLDVVDPCCTGLDVRATMEAKLCQWQCGGAA